MERNIPRLLFILLVSFMLSAPPPGAAKYIRKVDPHDDSFKWKKSSKHCKEFHDGLISIRNHQEAEKISKFEGWIGLHKVYGKWVWRTNAGDEEAKFLIWDDGQPDSNEACVWKLQGHVGWRTMGCNQRHVFICVDYDGILVQEKKTWEEALQHCRELQHDLASLPETHTFLLNREAIREDANTDEVWVGLRFLAGEWLWMSGQAAWGSNLPLCPAPYLHCGAIVHNDTEFKIMDCSEKRNFLCSKRYGRYSYILK